MGKQYFCFLVQLPEPETQESSKTFAFSSLLPFSHRVVIFEIFLNIPPLWSPTIPLPRPRHSFLFFCLLLKLCSSSYPQISVALPFVGIFLPMVWSSCPSFNLSFANLERCLWHVTPSNSHLVTPPLTPRLSLTIHQR